MSIDFEFYNKISSYVSSKKGFSVCIHGDFQYPEGLRSAKYPANLFYYKGDLSLLNTPCISVVGSRNYSEGGMLRARKMGDSLARNDYTVVSGLASGIDTFALKEAMSAGGRVIGVIGTPIDEYYPKENRELQDEIARNHLLISQVPFFRYKNEPFSNKRTYFPRRNETMSAISKGTVIVEAGETSGTLTQARAALQQGRILMILNYCFENKDINWPEKYEKKGALRIREFDDLVKLVGG